MIIKLLLIAALATAAIYLVRGKGSALSLLMRRSVTMVAICLGVLAVTFPSAVTEVARSVGVGRGADLVLYALAVSFLFVSIALYTRLAALHDRHVELVRRLALLEAELATARDLESRG